MRPIKKIVKLKAVYEVNHLYLAAYAMSNIMMKIKINWKCFIALINIEIQHWEARLYGDRDWSWHHEHVN